jgi:hypothetical protein
MGIGRLEETGKKSSLKRGHIREEEGGWRDAEGLVVDTSESGWRRSLERGVIGFVVGAETGSDRIGGLRRHWYTRT